MILQETTPQERAALLTYRLAALGEQMTTAEAAQLLDVSQRTAQRTLNRLSRAIPIERDGLTGRWYCAGDVQISPY